MRRLFTAGNAGKTVAATTLALLLALPALPVAAQDNLAEARLRRMEAEIRALQRQVFPGGDGKFFAPEIAQQSASPTPAAGQPASSPLTDMLARMEALEGQVARITAQIEQNGNRLAQLETRIGAGQVADSPASPSASPASVAVAAAASPTPSPSPGVAPLPGLAGSATPAAKPSPAPARAAAPSAQRLAAVRAIVKPQTDDPGEDEYSYGFRLWDAKFYPEAQQQLKLVVDKYPRHPRISFARNLLGRAFLDDGKPRDAAQWFLQNYNANKAGDRAPDSLLNLAEAMRRLNDSSRACIAIAEFSETYSREAAGRLKAQYDTTRAAVKCN